MEKGFRVMVAGAVEKRGQVGPHVYLLNGLAFRASFFPLSLSLTFVRSFIIK